MPRACHGSQGGRRIVGATACHGSQGGCNRVPRAWHGSQGGRRIVGATARGHRVPRAARARQAVDRSPSTARSQARAVALRWEHGRRRVAGAVAWAGSPDRPTMRCMGWPSGRGSTRPPRTWPACFWRRTSRPEAFLKRKQILNGHVVTPGNHSFAPDCAPGPPRRVRCVPREKKRLGEDGPLERRDSRRVGGLAGSVGTLPLACGLRSFERARCPCSSGLSGCTRRRGRRRGRARAGGGGSPGENRAREPAEGRARACGRAVRATREEEAREGRAARAP